MKSKFICLWIAWCCVAAAAPPVCAQAVTMTAEVGFGGYYRVGAWTPVTVIIENRGGPIEGEIAFEKSQMLSLAGVSGGLIPTATYIKRVTIPSDSKKRFNLYVRLDKTTTRADVSLRSRGRTIAQQEVKLNALYDEDELVVVYAAERGALSYLASLKSPKAPSRASGITILRSGVTVQSGGQITSGAVVVQYPREDYMPDMWVGYDGVDVLVFGRISPKSLSSRQQRAIQQWVAAGGGLVVSGGFDWQRFSDDFFDGLLPVSAEGVAEIPDSAALASSYGSRFTSAVAMSVTTGGLLGGASVYLAESAATLITERRHGAGTVVFLAFDYAAEPIRSWRGGADMWLDLMSLTHRKGLVAAALEREAGSGGSSLIASSGYSYRHSASPTPSILSALTFSEMEPPSFGLVGLFLIAYVVCLVPVTYFTLAKLGRRELAWAVMPAVVVVFSVAAYLASYAIKGGDILINQVGFIETTSGSPEAAVDTFALVFSPKKTSYDIAIDSPGSVIEAYGASDEETLLNFGEGLTYVQGETPSMPGLAMNMWSSRAFHIRSGVDMGGGVSVSLSGTGGGAAGRIANDTSFDLWDCCLIVPDYSSGTDTVYYVGDILHGESVDIDQAIRRAVAVETAQLGGSDLLVAAKGAATPEQRSMMQRAVEAVYEPSKSSGLSDPMLVAWTHEPLPRVDIEREQPLVRSANMLVVRTQLGQEANLVYYPEGASAAVVTQTTGEANTFDPSSLVKLGGDLSAEIDLSLPHLGPAVALDRLKVRMSVTCTGRSGESPAADISLFDRSAGRWQVQLSKKSLGRGSTADWFLSPDRPGDYVGSDGKIRLKVETSAGDNELVIREVAAELAGHRR